MVPSDNDDMSEDNSYDRNDDMSEEDGLGLRPWVGDQETVVVSSGEDEGRGKK